MSGYFYKSIREENLAMALGRGMAEHHGDHIDTATSGDVERTWMRQDNQSNLIKNSVFASILH